MHAGVGQCLTPRPQGSRCTEVGQCLTPRPQGSRSGHGHWPWALAMDVGHGRWPWALAMVIIIMTVAMATRRDHLPWPLAMAICHDHNNPVYLFCARDGCFAAFPA